MEVRINVEATLPSKLCEVNLDILQFIGYMASVRMQIVI